MSRAAYILEWYDEQNAALSEAEEKDKAAQAARSALSTLARLRRFINSVKVPLSDTEKRLLDLLISQVQRKDPQLAKIIKDKVVETEKELERFKKEVTTASKEEQEDLDKKADEEKKRVESELKEKATKEIERLKKELEATIKKDREDTYADILGMLRKISLNPEDFNRDKIQKLRQTIFSKQQIVHRRKLEQRENERKIDVYHVQGGQRGIEYARLVARRKAIVEEIKDRLSEIKRLSVELSRLRQESAQIARLASNLMKSFDRRRLLDKEHVGLISLGPIENVKIKLGKSKELSRLQKMLNRLGAYGKTGVFRDAAEKVSSREAVLTQYERTMFDKISDIRDKMLADLTSVKKTIDDKYGTLKKKASKENTDAEKLVRTNRRELYNEILRELERIRQESEQIREWVDKANVCV
jgi:hypothetical protein